MHRGAIAIPRVAAAGAAQATRSSGPSGDSLRNGALVGALVGAVSFGVLGGVICQLEQEPGAGNCLADTMRVAAIGAGIGLGAGLAVDAALSRQAGSLVRLTLRF